MELDYWKNNWDELGRNDPLWVVLTDESKRGGKWEVNEFFETGRREIESVFRQLESLGIAARGGKALDFGCGVGRLSQALSNRFEEVHGVDISPSMISSAKDYAQSNGRCHFHVNTSDRLDLFGDNTFNFVYSNIALQHIEPQYAKNYIREFVRVLSPGGCAVFQALSATALRGLFPQFAVDFYRSVKHRGKPVIGMFGIPKRQIVDLLTQSEAEILSSETSSLGWRWNSHLFIVQKRAALKQARP